MILIDLHFIFEMKIFIIFHFTSFENFQIHYEIFYSNIFETFQPYLSGLTEEKY